MPKQSMPNAEPTSSSSAGQIRALVSVHDVMPETLPQVERILTLLDAEGIAPVTLLVVPGTGWNNEGIERLRGYQARGCELAGHGWVHRVERITGFAHRVHSRVISRNSTEVFIGVMLCRGSLSRVVAAVPPD